jgi:hypothetical protein
LQQWIFRLAWSNHNHLKASPIKRQRNSAV